jgi:hypothetical protein
MHLDLGNLVFYNKRFTDVYEASIYAFRISYLPIANVPRNPSPFIKYRTIIWSHDRYPNYTFEEAMSDNKPITKKYSIVYHIVYRSARIIQKYYRNYLKRKMDAIIFLQYHLRKAIANPYTELCRKRLLREFYEMPSF